ncbi:MAG: serine/threonine protein kinase, partial [Deltaproteobacteria bacterium]|nr:serine/threonine protein kinase [Deltaproteobacteria bacterium]
MSIALDRAPELPKYELLERIGTGGMAMVYRARDRRLGREVAVKLIHPHLRESAEVAARFVSEARAVARLRHPNVVEVFDVSDADEPERYLVVELVRGVTLRTLLSKHRALPPELGAAIGLELVAALEHAHAEGIVHRDVKPENVLIDLAGARSGPAPTEPRGRRPRVKLTDFGIAKLLDAQGVTSTGQVLGSPAHMAPEQIEGGDVGPRADVFALGVLLYECMVGGLP